MEKKCMLLSQIDQIKCMYPDIHVPLVNINSSTSELQDVLHVLNTYNYSQQTINIIIEGFKRIREMQNRNSTEATND